MKIRKGFVSNSSSASFIITIGEVTNKEQFHADTKELEIGFEFRIIDGIEEYFFDDNQRFLNELKWEDWCGYYFEKEKLDKVFFDNPKAIVFIKTGDGGHDDSDFWNGEYYEYDKLSVRAYHEIDQKLYNAEVRGMKVIEHYHGAGRCG